jgi:hypothetical protein
LIIEVPVPKPLGALHGPDPNGIVLPTTFSNLICHCAPLELGALLETPELDALLEMDGWLCDSDGWLCDSDGWLCDSDGWLCDSDGWLCDSDGWLCDSDGWLPVLDQLDELIESDEPPPALADWLPFPLPLEPLLDSPDGMTALSWFCWLLRACKNYKTE